MGAAPETADEILLSIVVPVFNEKDNVRPLIGEIRSAIQGRVAYELVYVDDGSDDGTRQVLEELLRTGSPELHVVAHESRRGQSSAILTGIHAARGAWIATLDGDGQNDPTDIPRLLETVTAAHEADPSAVCIAGTRIGRKDTLVKRLSSRVANAIRRRILGDGIPDTGCGLKIFKRTAFLALPHFDHIHRFIPALFQFSGGNVLTANVSHRPRIRGVSKYGVANRLWVGIVDLVGVCWLRSRAIYRPWKPV